VELVASLLKLVAKYRWSRHCQTWATMFYNYMVTSCQQGNFVNFLSIPDMKHIRLVLNEFVLSTQSNPEMSSLVSVAQSLEAYLKQHKMDPFCCLIGLQPSKDVIELSKLEEGHEEYSASLSKSELIRKLLNWAHMDDAVVIQQELREFASELRGVRDLKPGSLVIVDSGTQLRYARIPMECGKGSQISLYVDPNEFDLHSVNIDKVYPLKPPTLNRIAQVSSLAELERLIHSPTDTLYQELMRTVENRTLAYFNTFGIDMDAIRKANLNTCSISELQTLKSAQAKFTELCSIPPAQLFKELQDILVKKIEEFKGRTSTVELFQPTLGNTFRQLESFQVSALVTMNIHRYAGICESGLDQLMLQKRELMNGERKDKISAWWLAKIDKAVLDFLANLGYQNDAIPENYVEQPPTDMNAVLENVKILSKLLAGEETDPGVKKLIEQMKEQIYPHIDTFLTDAAIVLSEQFNMDLTGKDFSLSLVEEAFHRERPTLDSKISEWIDDMLKDISYLTEMKLLEDPEYTKDKTEFSLHIVPISGLVVGSICRLENECKTVCELWQNDPEEVFSPQESPTSTANRTLLHEAVIRNDLKRVEEILDQHPDNVNFQDSNGWTPLHYSINLPSNEIFNRLMECAELDVNKKDAKGNTALLFLVRYPPDSSKFDFSKISQLLEHKADVNCVNISKDTPLHFACYNSCVQLVQLFLEHKASPVARNSEGQDCIQIAVSKSNYQIVKNLLEYVFKYDPTSSVSGKSALDLASECEDKNIFLLLQEYAEKSSRVVNRLSSALGSSAVIFTNETPSIGLTRMIAKSTSSLLDKPNDEERLGSQLRKTDSCDQTLAPPRVPIDWTVRPGLSPQRARSKISLGSNRS